MKVIKNRYNDNQDSSIHSIKIADKFSLSMKVI